MEQLGLQPMQLAMQAINFAVLVFILTKLLFRPLMKMIEERKIKIKEGLDLQSAMVQEKENLVALGKKEVDKGRKEAQKIIAEAKTEAKDQSQKIVTAAQKMASEEKEKAANEIEGMRKHLESQIKKDTVELAAAMAERVLGDILKDTSAQHKLITKRLNALKTLSHENK